MGAHRLHRTTAPLLAAAFILTGISCSLDRRIADGREVIYLYLDEGDLDLADELLDDCWTLPRHDTVCLDGPPTWTEDPFGENYWRMVFYSLRHTRHLLWAYRETGDTAYRDKLLEILTAFVDEADTQDPLWDKHTAAFRAMVLVNTYVKLDDQGDLDDPLARRLRDKIRRLGGWLADPGHFDDDYNHGFTEAAALALIAHNFPEWDLVPGRGWAQLASDRLDTLLHQAVDPDGVEVEQSPYYHLYVMAFVWQIQDWASTHGAVVPTDMDARMGQMVRYTTLVAQPDGNIPLIGSGLGTNIRTFDPDVMARIADEYPEFRFVRTAGVEGESPAETVALFPSSGQIIARSGFGSEGTFEDQTHLVFDVGSYRTTHSHVDALSLHLYADGRTLLPDSGLFSYEQSDLHQFFRSTDAHNTVVVDGDNQDKGSAAAISVIDGDGWAYFSGHHRLYGNVEHGRAVVMLDEDLLLVLDRLEGDREHRYSQTWHLSPGATFEGPAEELVVIDEEGGATLRIVQAGIPPTMFTARHGSSDPLQGWLSREYEILIPRYTLEYVVWEQEALFATLFAFGERLDDELDVSITGAADDLLVEVTGIGQSHRLQVSELARPGESVELH